MPETKEGTPPQAPAQETPPQQKGLESWTPDQLAETYDKSPELFAKVVEKIQPKKEAKPEGEKPPDGAAKPDGVELKLREGVPVDDKALKQFKEIMLDKKLSDLEKAQKLYDLQADSYVEAVKGAKEREKKFEDALKADPEFGKDYEANMAIAQEGLLKFDKDGALQKVLVERGLSKDPVLVRYFHQIGKAAGEAVTPKPPTPPVTGAPKTEEDVMRLRFNNSPDLFGDTPKEQRQ